MANRFRAGIAAFVAHGLAISGSLDPGIFFYLWSIRMRLFKCWLSSHLIGKLIRKTCQQ